MRLAYYYNQPARLPADHPDNNPYGTLLCEALERQGIAFEYTEEFGEDFLRRNAGRLDAVHFNWPHYMYYDDDAQIMAARMRRFVDNVKLARELGYAVVWTAHNLYPHNDRHRDIDRQFRLELCRHASAVIVHCRVAAAALQQHFAPAGRLLVIPHGTFLGVYTMPFSKQQARERLGIPSHDFVYATLGHIRPYKGIDSLVDTFRNLDTEGSWLVVTGGSKNQADLDALRDRVRDHPRIVLRLGCPRPSNDDFLSAIQAADVITQPFSATTTSGTLMLALSCARPVIAPAMGCLPDLVTDAAGILYPPAEAGALQRAMLAMHKRDVSAAGRAALAIASQDRFNWDTIARQTIEAYQK